MVSFRIKNKLKNMKDPFNGVQIKLTRVPNIGEQISFSKGTPFTVIGVKTSLIGWKEYHEVLLR